jgi:hypothetical protein
MELVIVFYTTWFLLGRNIREHLKRLTTTSDRVHADPLFTLKHEQRATQTPLLDTGSASGVGRMSLRYFP